MAFLIENYAGHFPLWLAPVQAMVIPIADRHVDYAEQVAETLRAAGLRVEVDSRKERMKAKVRDAQLQKVPYMLVVGDKEAEPDAVSLRLRTNENIGAVPLAEFVTVAKRPTASAARSSGRSKRELYRHDEWARACGGPAQSNRCRGRAAKALFGHVVE